jgi:methylated-DNA-[protein]-cysteine S-methyltransferase
MITHIDSPIGPLTLACDDRTLYALFFGDEEKAVERSLEVRFGSAKLAGRSKNIEAALAGYFAGDLRALDRIEVVTGGSPFQRDVWKALRTVAVGTTISYAELAARIGRPSATRAVGMANGQNPIAIVVPCHRVIGSDRSLTGYGGGLEKKRWLLEHEGAAVQRRLI